MTLSHSHQVPANGQAHVVLASRSPRRVELLRFMGVKFDCRPSDIEEHTDETEPSAVVQDLAKAKALHVAEVMQPDLEKRTLILGADTIVVLGNDILGKPHSREEAYQILMRMSGRCHKVYTGVSLIDLPSGGIQTRFAVSDVYFRKLDPSEVRCYVKTDEPMDKAGAYALQGIASAFVEKIDGCYTNIIGLPVPLTISMFRAANVTVLGLP